MNTQELVYWLLDNGGPTIRYRTAIEIYNGSSKNNLDKLEAELIKSRETVTWIEYLGSANKVNRKTFHGSFNTCFENAMSKLVQLGMRAGMPILDEITLPYRNWLAENIDTKEDWGVFTIAIIASLLAIAGYTDHSIKTFLLKRLDVLYKFTFRYDYNIYDDSSKYRGLPKNFQDKPIINPELYEGGNYKYPLIYDVYGLSAMITWGGNEIIEKIETIIKYILSSEYHNLADGYGILAATNNKYHGMGWDVKVPCYFGIGEEVVKAGAILLQRMELMAHFQYSLDLDWFKGSLKHFETFRTVKGTYAFPKHYLQEKEGYWVCGTHMGLGENRRVKIANEIESTFWILKIKKLAGYC